MPSWSLTDADVLAQQYKYTFYKPGVAEISKVQPGEVVKLIFAFESDDPAAPSAERMWVKVLEVLPGLKFRGALDNEPRYIKDLKPDDVVEFEARHIINCDHDSSNNLVERYIKRCFVTHRILEDQERVGYLYREDPDRDDDSGWRMTAGDESDEYMDNADNHSYVSLGAVLSVDDSFVGLLDSPSGSAYARVEETGEFVPVDAGS
ncbi:MAG: DUF2185 domain-containing protein [Steroidobacteraceae bacterium]